MTLVLCCVLPIICLTAIVVSQVIKAVETKNDAEKAKEDIEYLLRMDGLVTSLQVGKI